jgi:hypothetical protein
MIGLKKQRDSTIQEVTRWLSELDRGPRGTLSMGMIQQAAIRAEELLRQCVRLALDGDVDLTEQVLAAVAKGKRSVDKMTFGECSHALQYLDTRKRLPGGRRLIPNRDRELLDRTVKLRNDFTHRPATEIESVRAFLVNVLALCSMPVITAAVLRDAD